MPDLSPLSLIVAALGLLAGLLLGWILRSNRGRAEKVAINEGWQAQMDATRNEHRRLAEQNKRLMEQVSDLQSSSRQAGNQARELSEALKDALARRDDVQHEIKVVRNNLESLVSEKHRLKSDLSKREASVANAAGEIEKKDAKIERLSKELRNWQDRLPPLVERFRERNDEAERLSAELAEARERIAGLEEVLNSDETRVGPLAAGEMLDSVEASNEWLDDDPIEPAGRDDKSDTDNEPVPIQQANGSHFGGLRDNLKAIKGIGPAIEKTLNELGIFRYAQVADMSHYDIERIANRLKGFKSRIEREDWIGQARTLSEQKSAAASMESGQGEY